MSLSGIDAILGIRDSIGAAKKLVYLVTRTWWQDVGHTIASSTLGEGYAVDTEVQLLPSPLVVDYSQNIRVMEGGGIKAGDIVLKSISKTTYAETDLDGSSSSANVEKLYRVGAKMYQVISITEGYVTWNVQLRELTNQARY